MTLLKQLVWIGSSKADLKNLPEDVQDKMSYSLHKAQAGRFPNNAPIELSYEIGSENVFADLGMTNADEKLAKAELALKINQLLKARGLKQVAAAKLLGIDQAKVSYLSTGRLSGFSIERLMKFLALLGQDIVIIITPHKAQDLGHITVVC